MPSLKREAIEHPDAVFFTVESPHSWPKGIATLTDISRITDLKRECRSPFYRAGDQIHKDDIRDDQGLPHSYKRQGARKSSRLRAFRIINTILFAQRISGVEKIYAVIGGFHLPPVFEKIIRGPSRR